MQTPLKLTCLALLVLVPACSSLGYSLQEPHIYNNSFNEVVENIEKVLVQERMVVQNAETLADKSYRIYFYKKTSQIQERDFQSGHTATITVREIEQVKTSVHIKENKQESLTTDQYREYLVRDVLKALEKVLSLEPKTVLAEK